MLPNTYTAFTLLSLFIVSCAAGQLTKIPLHDRRSVDERIQIAQGSQLDSGVPIGIVHIGNPPQRFIMAMDTTLGYSWVRGSRCVAKNCEGRCTYYATHSRTTHSTRKKFAANYGTGECVDTTVYTDTFRLENLTVNDMPFGGAFRMTGFDGGFDGYLGLGRNVDFNRTKASVPALASRDVSKLTESGFISNAMHANGIQSAQFGIYTTNQPSNPTTNDTHTPPPPTNSSSTAPAPTATSIATTTTTMATTTTTTTTTTTSSAPSETPVSGGSGFARRSIEEKKPYAYLVLGGIDMDAIQGDVAYTDALNPESGNWQVNLSSVVFGNALSLAQTKDTRAVISTSSAYITMPPDQADKFHDSLPANLDKSTNVYIIDCSDIEQLQTLTMTFDGVTIDLPPAYWTYVVDKSRDRCATRFARGHYSTNNWSLGSAFTNAFYTTFDIEKNRVGFAFKKGHTNDGLRLNEKSS